MLRSTLSVSVLLSLLTALALSLAACSGDDGPRPDGAARDQAPGVDRALAREAVPAGDTACVSGEKRCATLYKIEECVGGAWKAIADCKTKTSGGQPCTCSPTHLFVCALGGKECP